MPPAASQEQSPNAVPSGEHTLWPVAPPEHAHVIVLPGEQVEASDGPKRAPVDVPPQARERAARARERRKDERGMGAERDVRELPPALYHEARPRRSLVSPVAGFG